MNPAYSVPRYFRGIRQKMRCAWQRLFRGYDEHMEWEYKIEMPRITLKVLDFYINERTGTPVRYSEEEWNEKLRIMKRGFELLDEMDDLSIVDFHGNYEEYQKQYDILEKQRMECMEVFSEHLPYLWD